MRRGRQADGQMSEERKTAQTAVQSKGTRSDLFLPRALDIVNTAYHYNKCKDLGVLTCAYEKFNDFV